MLKAQHVLRQPDDTVAATSSTLTLRREERYRRRVRWVTDQGEEFLLDLSEATYLADGDGLRLDDGRCIRVVAATEALLKVVAGPHCSLAKLAWHIGNRHTPAEIAQDAIYIMEDTVLAQMLTGLGARVEAVQRPFEPEGGAYGGHGSLHESHHHGAQDHGGDHAHNLQHPHHGGSGG